MFLDEIMPIHIDKFVVDLSNTRIRGKEDNFLSSGTIEYIYRVLKNVLTRAHKWKFIRENPMAELDKPKAKYKTFDIYDADEARQVIECLYKETTMWRLFILGTMLGGFRRGEIIAVEWTDVCFDDLTISVNKNITGTEKGKAIIGDPKTEKSKDTVDMPEWYMEELKKYNTEWKKNKLKAGSMWQGSDNEYVFHGGFGKPFYHTYPSEWWKRFCKRHKLKYIRFHDLRHTTATLLIEDGANMKEIQKRLRHSRYQTTADIYGHVTKKLSRATADRFNKLDPTKNVDRKIHSQFTPN
jgi:integrase